MIKVRHVYGIIFSADVMMHMIGCVAQNVCSHSRLISKASVLAPIL